VKRRGENRNRKEGKNTLASLRVRSWNLSNSGRRRGRRRRGWVLAQISNEIGKDLKEKQIRRGSRTKKAKQTIFSAVIFSKSSAEDEDEDEEEGEDEDEDRVRVEFSGTRESCLERISEWTRGNVQSVRTPS
jgi:hypothetical protein